MMQFVTIMKQEGYVGIVTVLIVSIVGLTVGVTIALLGSNELILGYTAEQGESVLQYADGCAEEAYYRLKKDPSYTGGTIPYGEGSCTVSISGGGSNRTITSTITIGNYTKTVEADLSLENNVAGNADGIDITAWDELE